MVTAVNSVDLNGIGMTSRRTRERLIQRMVEQGIGSQRVLDVMRTTPRHLFLAGLLVAFYILSITYVAPHFGIGNARRRTRPSRASCRAPR